VTQDTSAPVLVVTRLDDSRWSIDGVQVSVPEGELPMVFVLERLFGQVPGDGPWRADVHDGGPIVSRLLLHPDGSVSKAAEPVAEIAGSHGVDSAEASLVEAQALRRGPVVGRRALLVTGGLLGLAVVGSVAGVSIHSAIASSPAPVQVPAPTSTPTDGAKVLWRLPNGITGVRAAGPVMAGVMDGHLSVFDGAQGKSLFDDNGLVVADVAQVRTFSGGGVSVVDVGNGAGVFVIDGKATQYEGKGALLARGPVPVLVGGTTKARKYFALRNGALVAVKAPQSGNSLFGGLAGGGTVWAVAGGKVTYVPANGTHRTITLASPLKGAKVTSWVAVSETRTALIWTKGTDSVLAVHATGPGAKSAVELKQPLKTGQTAWADGPLVVIGPGQAGVKASGALVAVISLQEKKAVATPVPEGAAVVDGQLWTPSTAGTWAAGGFTVPSQPVAAGDGFALVAEGEKFVAVPGPSTTTK
jgi:hypothetical protein